MTTIPDTSLEKMQITFTEDSGIKRDHEPVSFGMPFFCGQVKTLDTFSMVDAAGRQVDTCFTILAYWHDKSIKWAVVDMQVSVDPFESIVFRLERKNTLQPLSCTSPVSLSESHGILTVDTGQASFEMDISKNLSLFNRMSLNSGSALTSCYTSIVLTDQKGFSLTPHIHSWGVEYDTPLRKTVCLKGRFGSKENIKFACRTHFYANKSHVKVDFSIVNDRPAFHPGGAWDLGDKNAFLFKELKMDFQLKSPCELFSFYTENLLTHPTQCIGQSDVCIYQGSSGGKNWDSPNHVNRDGKNPLAFQGFQVFKARDIVQSGLRSLPLLGLGDASTRVFCFVENFWQNFPKALSTQKKSLSIQLFPCQFTDVFELQPGEQKTHTFYFGMDEHSTNETPLRWVIAPLNAEISTSIYHGCMLRPGPVPKSQNSEDMALYDLLVEAAMVGERSFEHKNEQIDEYGWRNFGDVFADHEAVFAEDSRIFVSHYNNQYDIIKGAVIQYMRSGSRDWFDLARQMADHVSDIDIYHASEDKYQFNNGMFWHTDHHLEAFTSTHRTISIQHKGLKSEGSFGGGPAPDHNYTTGFLYLYWLTGDLRYKEALLALTSNIIQCINSPETICELSFQFLRNFFNKRGQGINDLGSNYGSVYRYDGPGRASGNSLNTLLDAWQLTADPRYVEIAECLIYKCISMEDDFERMELLNAELRWMYTIFLQALGKYLDLKKSMEQYDDPFYYARNAFIHYAKWMADNEYPYLEKPETLEFPNETWAAQDIRKADIFAIAVTYAPLALKPIFSEKSQFFFHHSLSELKNFDTQSFTRPLAILMTNGMPSMELMTKGVDIFDNQPFKYSAPDRVSFSFFQNIREKIIHFSIKKEIQWIKTQLRSYF